MYLILATWEKRLFTASGGAYNFVHCSAEAGRGYNAGTSGSIAEPKSIYNQPSFKNPQLLH